MENRDLEIFLDKVIEKEKMQEPDPFVSTRILQRIDSAFGAQQSPVFSILVRALQPATIALALLVGIFIGAYTARSSQSKDTQVAVKSENIENLKAELFIREHTDEDNFLNLTH